MVLYFFRWLHFQHVRPDDRSPQDVSPAQASRNEIHQGSAHHVHLQTCKTDFLLLLNHLQTCKTAFLLLLNHLQTCKTDLLVIESPQICKADFF
jgi:hypothetical protein